MNFGEKLFRLRTERGIFQKELAEYLEVSIGTISNYENGIHYPDLSALCKFAEYFHVSTDYLLDLTENAMPIDSLNIQLADGCTIGNVLNTVMELSRDWESICLCSGSVRRCPRRSRPSADKGSCSNIRN